MKLIDYLIKEQIKQMNQLRNNKAPKTKKKRAKKLNQSVIRDLTGVHRDTYKRVNGAVRR